MKTKCLWVFALALLVTSCAGRNMIRKDAVLTGKGSSIIYGKFSELSENADMSFSLYNRKTDKFYDFMLKSANDTNSSLVFAYEIPAGKYELFSFTKGFSKMSGYDFYIYHWLNNIDEVHAISNKLLQYNLNNYNKYFYVNNKSHTEIEIPEGKYIYIGDWSFNSRNNEPRITNNKLKTDIETANKFPAITNNSITIIPETKVFDYLVSKISNNLSIAVIYLSNIILIDNKTTNFNKISSIYVTNKDSNKIYKYSASYDFNKLCFINGLPFGKYKVKNLNFPSPKSPISANFTEDNIPEGVNILEGKFVLNLGGDYLNNFDYKNAGVDFNIEKPGIYYLGSYDLIVDIRNAFDCKTQVVSRPDRIKEDLNTIKNYLVDENTGWDINNIYIISNVFYSTNFILH